MRKKLYILFISTVLYISTGYAQNTVSEKELVLDFYGDSIALPQDSSILVDFSEPLSKKGIGDFYSKLTSGTYQLLIQQLLQYRDSRKLDDWFYYQLIRTTAEKLSPKAANYHRYTLYKWFLLNESGYSSTLRFRNDTLLLYVRSEENIYDIPYYMTGDKQYVCLNYHDYNNKVAVDAVSFTTVALYDGGTNRFSYKVTRLPQIRNNNFTVKQLYFDYKNKEYKFNVLLDQQVQKIFTNYPVVDYASQFGIPLSQTTYNSLVPLLKEAVSKMNQQQGVDYLMHFTRSAFLFETDTKAYGKEKRLSAEQTLFYEYSDCEDRSAFFFFLVKEIYQLPMIVLSYPTHITVAVQFDKASGTPILYNGEPYWVCEPTPQKKNLKIGELLPSLKNQAFEVVYAYKPH
ncbi:hypothetical protein [Sediminibacterium goheungense]|uniref:Transglutaminase superfamily protein n=1 Tax=Sediminibacterium goheungense TaxID=1086393 RepID=A0A4R6J259_9BACT|nr:hypothetical protein [Sediminibacterium goheungense]TDO29344.1 hypothetical protein BC659_1433 [Sediminibacterium goheungense]